MRNTPANRARDLSLEHARFYAARDAQHENATMFVRRADCFRDSLHSVGYFVSADPVVEPDAHTVLHVEADGEEAAMERCVCGAEYDPGMEHPCHSPVGSPEEAEAALRAALGV